MDKDETKLFNDISHCIRFAEGWYSNRPLSLDEILMDFEISRPTISSYLTSHIPRGIVKKALDEFKSTLLERLI